VSLSDQFIKFQLKGSSLDPAHWMWYRIPRASVRESGKQREKGVQVGYRRDAPPAEEAAAAAAPAAPARPAGRRFLGAGLGLGTGGAGGAAPAAPGAPGAPRSPEPEASQPRGSVARGESRFAEG